MPEFSRTTVWGIRNIVDAYPEIERDWNAAPREFRDNNNNAKLQFTSTWSPYSKPKIYAMLMTMLEDFTKTVHQPTIKFMCTGKSYACETPSEYYITDTTGLLCATCVDDIPDSFINTVRINYMSRRYTTLRDHLIQFGDENPDTIIRCTDIEALIGTNNVYVFKDAYGNYCILVNNLESVDTAKLMGMIPALFPRIRDALNNTETEKSYNLQIMLNAFYNRDANAAIVLVKYLITTACERAMAQIYDKFKDTMIQQCKTDNRTIEQEIANWNREVQNMLNNIEDYKNRIKEAQALLLGYALGESEVDTSVVEMLRNMNNVNLISVNDNCFTIRVTTPVLYYNLKDVQMYYKRNQINMVTQHPWMAELIKRTFIERKYQLITTTDVYCPWNPQTQRSKSSAVTGAFPNPHMFWYQCYSQAISQYNNAIRNNNWQTAINAFIAACASITFTDSTVIQRTIKELVGAYNNTPCFQNVETKQMFSAGQFKAWFNGGANQEIFGIPINSTENDTTTATQANAEAEIAF